MTRSLLLLVVLGCALPARAAIYIVRHAEKVITKSTDNPPLTAAGKERAKDLARALRSVKLAAVYVTEFKRTQDTAAPAAKASGVKPIQIKADEVVALSKVLRDSHAPAGQDVLVVAHSDTIPELLKALGAADGPQEELGTKEYDNLFVLDLGKGATTLHWLHYGK